MCLLTNWPRYLLLAAILLCALGLGLHAQNALPTYPQKFGKITLEELKMQKYAPDSNAHAVYLQDIGKFEFESGNGVFTIMRRIKILDEAGYESGNFFYPTFGNQQILRVQATTYTLGKNDSIVQTQLDKKDIFKEKIVSGVRGIRFAMPNLKPGAVLEYKVEISGGVGFTYSWEFQKDEPVMYTEFNLTYPNEITYQKRYRGYMQNLYRKVGNKKVPASTSTVPGNETWVMENVPAFREKEFLIDEDDYKTSMEFQVENIIAVGSFGSATYFMNWDKLGEQYRTQVYTNAHVKPCGESRHAIDSLLKGKTSARQKLGALYEYVQSTVKWNGSYSEIPRPEGPCQTLKKKEGNTADINLMLIGMCRAAGFVAHPVVTSIRGRSKFYSAFPFGSQLNNVVAMVETGKDTLWLDASQREVPFPHLPEEDLVGTGYLVLEDKCKFVAIPEKQVSAERVQVSAKLDAEGKVEGTFSVSFEGENANDYRELLQEKDEQDLARKTLLEDINNLSIEDIQVSKTDTMYNRVRIKGKLTGEEYASTAGNELFMNPVMLLRYDESTFSEPTRKYPVELYMPTEYAYSINVSLPEGYEAVNLPKSQRLRLEDGSGEITRVVRYEGTTLGYSIKLLLRKTLYSVEEYESLRKLHQLSADMNKEQIQIRKKL